MRTAQSESWLLASLQDEIFRDVSVKKTNTQFSWSSFRTLAVADYAPESPIWTHEEPEKRYVWLTSAVIRLLQLERSQKISKISYDIYHCKKCLFCTRLLLNISKGQLMELYLPFILPYYGLASVINNNCHPLGKSILGLDTNQRTLNLKFRGLFFWRVASSRAARLCAANVTFLSLFGLDFVKTTFKTIIGDLACGIFFLSFKACKAAVLYNAIDIIAPFISFIAFVGLCWSLLLVQWLVFHI